MNNEPLLAPEIIFEDEHLLVIHKPSGMASTPAPNTQNVLDFFPNCHPAHRLDTRATGLLLLAKTPAIQTALTKQFTKQAIQKTYAAVTKNAPQNTEGTLTNWLVKKPNKSLVFSKAVPDGKLCELSYKIEQKSERYTLWRIQLITGRFHQIRAQLAAINCAIVGDTKYGYARTTKNGSIYLQACELAFSHPISGESLHFSLPIPADWKQLGLTDKLQ